jgi:cytochrome b6-f complex iron-sulfur subunit
MTIAVLLAATATGLLALAFWWIRRSNPAAATVGAPPLTRSAPGCPMGQQLLMASAGGNAGGSAPTGQGASGTSPRKSQKRAPTNPSRRQFLRTWMGVSWLGVLGGFGGASLAMLWPSLRGGFGAELPVASEEEILEYIRTNREPFPYPTGRCYIVEYDPADDREDEYVELTNGASLMAIYQVCVHLGCKVPWCQTSQWLECPCHGSRYNRWGEWQGGPAARGLDRFPLTVENGEVIVDTGQVITGPSRQTPSLDQPPEGPSCL